MEQEAYPLTRRFLRQAHDAFRERCCTHPPPLRELFEEVIQIARQVSDALSPEQVLLLLQEHPEWVHAKASMPGRDPIAIIIAEQLAYLIRQEINEHWATLLLHPASGRDED